MTKKPFIVHVYPKNDVVVKKFYDKLGYFRLLVPSKVAMRYIGKRYFPNNLLIRLKKKGILNYQSYIISTEKKLESKDADLIPKADIWLFSLINLNDEEIYTSAYFDAIKKRANHLSIKLLHLTSHLDSSHLDISNQLHNEYPKIAKLTANGMVIDFNTESFCIINNEYEEKQWITSKKSKIDNYSIQPFLKDQRVQANNELYFIERWLVIGNDLTVGMRYSSSPIVKQHNSITYYRRDFRNLTLKNELEIVQSYLNSQQLKKGLIPATFEYFDDNEFWDKRYQAISDLKLNSGFDLGSMDVLCVNDQLIILDFNEHTLESLYQDLSLVLCEALKEYLNL